MAMTMQGEVTLPADRERVWAALNDPAVLKACIPGVQELEKLSDTAFRATAKVAIGPVKATWWGANLRSRPAARLPDFRRRAGRRRGLRQGRRPDPTSRRSRA